MKTSPASQNARCAPSQRPVTPARIFSVVLPCARSAMPQAVMVSMSRSRRAATGPTQPSGRTYA